MKPRKIPLAVSTLGEQEARSVAGVVRSGRVTQGVRVRTFERAMLRYLGANVATDAIMVNSGSSANLLAAQALAADGQGVRREVITTALTWSTTIAPLLQHRLRPVFVDVGWDLTMDPEAVRAAVEAHPNAAAVLPVHLVGNPCHMDEICRIAQAKELWVFEDCCEALGAAWNGRKVGTFGQYASFSFFFSHHLSTIEGGLLVFSEGDTRLRAWREHGWIRDYPAGDQAEIRERYPDLDPRWIFDQAGYNLRSTELNAALGLLGLRKQPVGQVRRLRVASWYSNNLVHDTLLHPFQRLQAQAKSNPFSYPIITQDAQMRNALAMWLETRGIETRPVMTGNILRHPWLRDALDEKAASMYAHGELHVTDVVHERGLLLPCRPTLTKADLVYVRDAINQFMLSNGLKPLGES